MPDLLASDPYLSAVGILEQREIEDDVEQREIEDDVEQREIEDDERWVPFCTGSLIGVKTVLTAYHCVKGSKGKDVRFRLSSNLKSGMGSSINVLNSDRDRNSPLDGGYMNQGSDVAVMELEAEADGPIEPLDVRVLDMHRVGKDEPFYGVGYYFQRNGTIPDGARRIAGFTLRATDGRFLEDAFLTKENFEQCSAAARLTPKISALSLSGGPFWIRCPLSISDDGQSGFPSIEDAYQQKLLRGYQVWLDDGPDGAQPCKGDSGGPLLRQTERGLAVYGVLSGSVSLVGSDSSGCGFGAVYSIVAPKTLKWLQDEHHLRR
ncbi:hypothetical protein BE15_27170 [Sorangium cellulosum]|uniref:Peptidase S1 domain-containing protein n=1 Tax=Sorangium cellulosum TaxID=56 RepID=A0A150QVG4_SORCE|nr:hypothetical protein BE15_27170 [Sorangium cellulosum]